MEVFGSKYSTLHFGGVNFQYGIIESENIESIKNSNL